MKQKHYLWFMVIGLVLTGQVFFLENGFAQEGPGGQYFENTLFAGDQKVEQASENEKEKAKPQEKPFLRIDSVTGNRFSMEFRNLEIGDLLRVFAHNYNLNILVDDNVKGKVTASFSNITLEEALEAILSNNNLASQIRGSIIKVSANLISKVFILKYLEAKELLAEDEQGSEIAATTTEAEGEESLKKAKANSIFDLLSEDGKIFLGKMPNSILVIDYPLNIKKVEEYLEVIDRKMASKVFKLKYLSVIDIAKEDEEDEDDEDTEEEASTSEEEETAE